MEVLVTLSISTVGAAGRTGLVAEVILDQVVGLQSPGRANVGVSVSGRVAIGVCRWVWV